MLRVWIGLELIIYNRLSLYSFKCVLTYFLTCHVSLRIDLLSRIDLDELMKKDEPPFTFPKTLEEFEYAFNESEYIYSPCKGPTQRD